VKVAGAGATSIARSTNSGRSSAFVTPQRDATAARRCFEGAFHTTKVRPVEVRTDRAATSPVVLEELLAAGWHRTEQHANNHIEADHGRLTARLGPRRGLNQDRRAGVIIGGHGLVQNLRRGHHGLAVEVPAGQRLSVAFDDLALAI
jgi:transposase-like protein